MPETSPASVKPKRNRARTQTRNYTDMCAHFARYLSADRAVEDEGGILFRVVVDREGHFRWPLVDVDDFHIDHGNGRTEILEHLSIMHCVDGSHAAPCLLQTSSLSALTLQFYLPMRDTFEKQFRFRGKQINASIA